MRRAIAVGLAAALFAAPAAAHPHVWIDVASTFVVAHGKIAAVRQRWQFDEFYSASLLKDFDKNDDGTFDADEIGDIRKNAFLATRDQGYFSHVKVDGKPVPANTVTDFSAAAVKGHVVYSFVLKLTHAVDPRLSALTMTYFENTYYVDIAPSAKNNVAFEGDGSLSCTAAVAPDPDTVIYFGQVHPLSISLRC